MLRQGCVRSYVATKLRPVVVSKELPQPVWCEHLGWRLGHTIHEFMALEFGICFWWPWLQTSILASDVACTGKCCHGT
jgi:hypothetical protein